LAFTEPSGEVDLLLTGKDGSESRVEMGGCGGHPQRRQHRRLNSCGPLSRRPGRDRGIKKASYSTGLRGVV